MHEPGVEDEIAACVARYADVPPGGVTLEARLWHDLKIAGDDFAELIEELHRAFGVALAGRLTDYCPMKVE